MNRLDLDPPGSTPKPEPRPYHPTRFTMITSTALTAMAISFLTVDAWPWVWFGIVLTVVAMFVRGTMAMRSWILGPTQCRFAPDDQVLLTYDDGPNPETTPALLELLRELDVRAVFFLIGREVDAYPDTARRIVEAGHVVGNHSYHHSPMIPNYFGPTLEREIERAQDAIETAAGVRPVRYRPPFGLRNHAVQAAARRIGLDVVGWNVRSLDTLGAPVDRVVERVVRKLGGGDIVLLHDGTDDTERVLELTRKLITEIRSQGFALPSLAN